MPTKDDPRITVRLDRAMYDDLRREADEKDLKLGAYVRRVLNLRNGTPVTIDGSVLKEAEANPGAFKREQERFFSKALHCPVPDCLYAAASPAARCPVHGRAVR